MSSTKYCPHCEKEKSHIDFYKNKSTKDGLSYWCKQCMKDHNKSKSTGKKKGPIKQKSTVKNNPAPSGQNIIEILNQERDRLETELEKINEAIRVISDLSIIQKTVGVDNAK